MILNAIIVLIYATIVLIGGIIGFAQANSLVSLIMGTVFAALLIGCGLALFKNSILGYYISFGLALILTLFFSYRYILTLKFLPSGNMAILSILVLIALFANRRFYQPN